VLIAMDAISNPRRAKERSPQAGGWAAVRRSDAPLLEALRSTDPTKELPSGDDERHESLLRSGARRYLGDISYKRLPIQ
jgi:hypothetical protein